MGGSSRPKEVKRPIPCGSRGLRCGMCIMVPCTQRRTSAMPLKPGKVRAVAHHVNLNEHSSLRWAFTVDKNLSPCQLKLLLKKLMYNLDHNLRMDHSWATAATLLPWAKGPWRNRLSGVILLEPTGGACISGDSESRVCLLKKQTQRV